MIVIEIPQSLVKPVQEIAKNQNASFIIRPIEPASTALDSPLSGEEIRVVVEAATIYLNGATAVFEFLIALWAIVKVSREIVTIRRPSDGKVLGTVGPDTSETELDRIAQNSQRP